MSENDTSRQEHRGARRAALAAILMAAGIASVVFAVGWHNVEVRVPVETPVETSAPQESTAQPEATAPPVATPAPPDGVTPAPNPFALPPEIAAEISQRPQLDDTAPTPAPPTELVWLTENRIILETTRGGVELDENGEIVQTYTGEPPEACPT